MTDIHLETTVPEALDGIRLDQALARLCPQYSRSQLQSWIKKGHVLVDGKPVARQRDPVSTDQTIQIHTQLEDQSHAEAQDIPLDIIYEDEALLIVNKPTGLIVHPGAGNPDCTMVNALLHHEPTLSTLPRAGVIHRLDKDTTGLLVVAKTLEAHHSLSQAMQAREISREYEAIVNGVMIAGGTVDANINRHPTQRTKMAVSQLGGRNAVTHYRVIERFQAHTHVRVQLETGRTHQIRVHLAHINYSIVGDQTYGRKNVIPPKLSESLRHSLRQFKRQALHAAQLILEHPLTHESMTFKAPLPQDMQQLLDALKQG